MNGNGIAITAPEQPHPGIHLKEALKEILAKLFSIKENTEQAVEMVLVNDLKQSKTVYKKLLKNIIDEVHNEQIISEEESRDTNFNYTKDGKRMHFNFDDDVVQDILSKYKFFKSGDSLDETRVKERMELMHKDKLHYKMTKNSMRKFNEDGRPYLDTDETGIVLKKAMKLGSGEFMDMPAGANSFN